MIARAFPLFSEGTILRNEMLTELANYAFLFGDLLYDGYCDGILSGCRLTTTKDAIIVNPGIIRHSGRNYLIKEPAFIPYYPTNSTLVLKIDFLDESRSKQFISYDIEISLAQPDSLRDGQIELCRFKLQPGARLRHEYVDFADRDTEYDTLNTLHVPYSSVGRATLSPEIIYDYARELSAAKLTDSLDATFCLRAMDRSQPVAADVIALYLASRLGVSADSFTTNKNLYDGLSQILSVVKRNQNVVSKGNDRMRPKILVD